MNASTDHPYLNGVIKKVQYNVLAKVSLLNKARPEKKKPIFFKLLFKVLIWWVARKVRKKLFSTTPALPLVKMEEAS